jgi:hypothetical protein
LTDAGLAQWVPVARHYIGFVKFADRAHFPDVDVYAEKGSGIDTVVGAPLSNLAIGQVLNPMTTALDAQGRHQPGGHHQRRRSCLAADALPPLQPHG